MRDCNPNIILSARDNPAEKLPEITPDRPAVLLIHGWAASADVMKPIAALLRGHCVCLFFELPGHGLTGPGPTGYELSDISGRILRIMRYLPARSRRIIVGWSLGALLALDVAALDSTALDGLVLAGAFARMTNSVDYDAGVPPETLRAMVRELRLAPERVLNAFSQMNFSDADRHNPFYEKALRILTASVLKGSPAEKLKILALLSGVDIRAQLPDIMVPVRLLHGDSDAIVPVCASQMIERACADTQLIQVAGSGHALPLLHPSEIANCVVALLREP